MGSSADGHSGSGDWAGMLWVVVPSGWFYFEQLDYCRTFQDYLLPPIGADGRISPAASLRASQRMSALTSNSPVALMLHHELFSALLLPGVSGVFQKTAFAQTGVEAVAVACALERYRLAHEKFPESLEALVPQFLAHVPRDVINGQPLKYRRGESNQYTVYSVGWNEIDDRGMLVPAKSGDGLELNQGDWVWQLELEDSGSSATR